MLSVPTPEVLFMQALSSATGVVGLGLLRWWSLRRAKARKRLFVVLISRKSGLTTQLQELDNHQNILLIDGMEDVLNSQHPAERELLKELANTNSDAFCVKMFPLIKQYLEDCRSTYKDRPIILFTSEPALVDFLKVPKYQTACLLPSLSMYQRLLLDFHEEDLRLLTQTRERLLKLPHAKFFFSSFSGLHTQLEKFLNRK